MSERSFYVDEYVDEINPCEPTLEGWAKWLGSEPKLNEDGNPEWGREAAAKDGDIFDASAILWQPDIIATRAADGTWSLSRQPIDDDFVAVRFGEGAGWCADNIIYPEIDWAKGEPSETMAQALIRFLTEFTESCDDIEYVAVGTHENGWRLTYNAGELTAERVQ